MSSAAAAAAAAPAPKRYFCHQCDRTVTLPPSSELTCPRCRGGFLEEFDLSDAHPGPGPDPDPAPFDFLSLLSALLDPTPNPEASPDPEAFDPLVFLQGYLNAISAEVELVVEGGPPGAALGDYFVGPGLERLIEQLAENDPNRYGTPPASKSAVASLPDAQIPEDPQLGADEAQCAVCMDDFEPGTRAKRMPCAHVFHRDCLMPWLELHCSCPVCRHELPTDDPDYESRRSGQAAEGTSGGGVGLAAVVGEEVLPGLRTGAVERRFRVLLPWPSNGEEGSGSGDGRSGGESGVQGEPRPETGMEELD